MEPYWKSLTARRKHERRADEEDDDDVAASLMLREPRPLPEGWELQHIRTEK